ncbi:MAG: ATP-binding protein, partial [Bacteroidetes bacterium]
MPQLRRLICLHSAAIPYQELDLGGNVHLMGGNGMGKSSLLRAILFFYTASDQQLGLAPHQEPFIRFYFPYPNSWLVYEVAGSSGPFLALVFRKKNQLRFRFVKGSYDPELFLDEKGLARTPDALAVELDRRSQTHSPVIDSPETYRDILYGGLRGKERTAFRPYLLSEVSPHPPLWQALTHIFLNRRLEASFLKQSLVSQQAGLTQLDLSPIRKALQDFDRHQADLQAFRAHESTARQILATSKWQREQQHRLDGLWQAWAKSLGLARQQLQVLQAREQKRSAEEVSLRKDLEVQQERYQTQRARLERALGALQHQIATAQRLAAQHEARQLKADAQRYAQLPELEARLAEPLPPDPTAVTLELTRLQRQAAAYAQALQQRQALEVQQHTQRSALEQTQVELQDRVLQLKEAIARQEGQVPNPTALEASRERLQHLREARIRDEIALAQTQQARRDMEQQRDQALSQLDAAWTQEQARLQQEISQLDDALRQLDEQLTQISGTFYGWLEDRYPDWDQSIGKVVREDVLFHPYLAPQIERLNDLLFGVRLDLSEIEAPDLSPQKLEERRKALTQQREAARKAVVAAQSQYQEKRLNTEKRYNRQKIRALQAQEQAETHRLQQRSQKIQKEKLHLQDLQQDARQQTEVALLRQRYALAEAETALQVHLSAREKAESEGREALAAVDSLLTKSLSTLAESVPRPSQADQSHLSGAGLREEILRLRALGPELIRYAQDCIRYTDRLPGWQQEADQLSQQLDQLQQSHRHQQASLQARLQNVQAEQAELEAEARRLKDQLTQAEAFASDHAPAHSPQGEGEITPDSSASLDLPVLMSHIYQLQESLGRTSWQLRQALQTLVSPLRPDNALGLPASLTGEAEVKAALDRLEDLLEGGQLGDLMEDLAHHFAQLAGQVGHMARALDAHEQAVGQLIQRVNERLRTHNFVGVVKQIALRRQEA